jgi:hypothetical protein
MQAYRPDTAAQPGAFAIPLITALDPWRPPMSTRLDDPPALFDPDDEFEAWTLDELDDLPSDAAGSMALGAGGRHGDHDD